MGNAQSVRSLRCRWLCERPYLRPGVLTKPDRAGRGDEEKWVTVLRNEHKGLELDNGWFSVKQPDTVQLAEGITRAEAKQEEEKFFQVTNPWASLPLKFRQRLGTHKLAERCSDLLSALLVKKYVMWLCRLTVELTCRG